MPNGLSTGRKTRKATFVVRDLSVFSFCQTELKPRDLNGDSFINENSRITHLGNQDGDLS